MRRIGKIYEGRWKVVRYEQYSNSKAGRYMLENIYNQKVIYFKDATLRKVDRGERTISWLISRRIHKERKIIE